MSRNWTAIAIVSAAIILVIGAYLVGQSFWIALTAFGTFGAVLVAIHRDYLLSWWKRPILEIGQYRQEPPFFREAAEYDQNTRQQVAIGYYINVQINNIGKMLATNCQPVLSAVGYLRDGTWRKEENWIPTGLLWSYRDTTGEQHEEKDLVPRRPYFFTLAHLTTLHPNTLILRTAYATSGQKFQYPPGEYCFEVSVFAEIVSPSVKYFKIRWDGGCGPDYEAVNAQIHVSTSDSPPW